MSILPIDGSVYRIHGSIQFRGEPITGSHFSQRAGIDFTLFEKHRNPCVILCASGLKGDRAQVFGAKDPGRNSVKFYGGGFTDCLANQRSSVSEDLNRPISETNIFPFD